MYCLGVWRGTKSGSLRSTWMTLPKSRQQLVFPPTNRSRLSPPLPTPKPSHPPNPHSIRLRLCVAVPDEPELISLSRHAPNHSQNHLCVQSVATTSQKKLYLLDADTSIVPTVGEHTYTPRSMTKAKWRYDVWMSRARYRQTTTSFDARRRQRTLRGTWSCSFGTTWQIHLRLNFVHILGVCMP